MKKIIIILSIFIVGCSTPNDELKQGKIERESISIVTKVPGRILDIYVQEGDRVQHGDTLAILDLPEVNAKHLQATGALNAANAQYAMSVQGATTGQVRQLEAKQNALKEQYDFAKKSLERMQVLLKDSLVPQQTYDETFAKYQGAKSQYLAVQEELNEARTGARIEQQQMALGQKTQAKGLLEEVTTAHNERYIIATQDMHIQSITLNAGELALPGYTLFSGFIENSVYFRFTIPESELANIHVGNEINLKVFYNNQELKGTVQTIKQLSGYADIATAYPDFELHESLFEVKIKPSDISETKNLINKATITFKL